MKSVYALATLVGIAAAFVACGDDPSQLTDSDDKPRGGSETGPGSSASTAHKFYIDSVHAQIQNCASCHANGSLGAPKFLDTNASAAYTALDARALIQANSVLLTKGSHAGGAAPALDANQETVIRKWLGLEAEERKGTAAVSNVLESMGQCLDEQLFVKAGLDKLVTQKRKNENANNCTGCDQTPCRTCHTSGDGNFYMGLGSALDRGTFEATKQPQYIVKYIGLNGTTPVPSNAIKAKAEATKTDKPYSHPMFDVSPELQAGIDAFVNDAIQKRKSGLCK